MPVFEDLLPPPHNSMVQDLLFTFTTWHAYAKLRLHTDLTLKYFEDVTESLGALTRKFARTTADAFDTKELPKELAARGRREIAKVSHTGKAKAGSTPTPKRKTLNLFTYKFHSLGDYPQTIRRYGTTDSFTTQTVCFLIYIKFGDINTI
jgi:hypothetical protein